MAYKESQLGLTVRLDEGAARARILEAYRKADGFVPAAAAILGVGARSLVRWTTELGLRQAVDKIRIAADRPTSIGGSVAKVPTPIRPKIHQQRRPQGRKKRAS